jgi:hypothetical protein
MSMHSKLAFEKTLDRNIYKMISNQLRTIYLPTIKWENDLSIAPDVNFWTQICKNIYLMSKNANLQLIQYKTLHRTHYTGNRLAKMGLASEVCTHCNHNSTDTYIHATLHCTPIKHFWEEPRSHSHYPQSAAASHYHS